MRVYTADITSFLHYVYFRNTERNYSVIRKSNFVLRYVHVYRYSTASYRSEYVGMVAMSHSRRSGERQRSGIAVERQTVPSLSE